MNYIPQLYAFFRELARNNNREWFAANRHRYDPLREAWMADVDRLIHDITEWYPAMASQAAKTAAYRIYRDTRFSQDKSPFKPYFSATLSPRGRNHCDAAFYLQMGPEHHTEYTESGLYGGMWQAPSENLKRIRRSIVDNREEFEAILAEPEMQRLFPDWCGAALKTVPQGYPKDHPLAPILRQKDFGKFLPADEKFFRDPAWPEKASDTFRILFPMVRFLNYAITEEGEPEINLR